MHDATFPGETVIVFSVLYHWAPAVRRLDIVAGGLRRRQPPTVCTTRSPYVYAAHEPRQAWALSGGMPHCAHVDLWDLWLIHVTPDDAIYAQPGADQRIHEVKIGNDVPAERCWCVGCRVSDVEVMD